MSFPHRDTFRKAVILIFLTFLPHVQNVFKQNIIVPLAALQPTYTPNYSSYSISVDSIGLFNV